MPVKHPEFRIVLNRNEGREHPSCLRPRLTAPVARLSALRPRRFDELVTLVFPHLSGAARKATAEGVKWAWISPASHRCPYPSTSDSLRLKLSAAPGGWICASHSLHRTDTQSRKWRACVLPLRSTVPGCCHSCRWLAGGRLQKCSCHRSTRTTQEPKRCLNDGFAHRLRPYRPSPWKIPERRSFH